MNSIKPMERYLWKGLDLALFKVIQITLSGSGNPIVIMRRKEPDNQPWCLEYRGNGHYFETEAQLKQYYTKRFGKKQKEV